jgi:putative membrane protein
MMGWYGNDMGGGGWILVGLFWVALIASIIWLVLQLLPSKAHTGLSGRSDPQLPGAVMQESPLDILDRRLAQREIDPQTYQAHRAALLAARRGEL